MRNHWLLRAGRAVGGRGPAREELLPVGTCRVHAGRNWTLSVPFLSWDSGYHPLLSHHHQPRCQGDEASVGSQV